MSLPKVFSMPPGETFQPRPSVYAIEIEIASDGTTVRTRYEAPTADEVVALAERSGERFEKPYIAGPQP